MSEEANMDKFTNMLHYIIYRCGDKPNVGKTVLYRLCYFSDFDYYELYEKKLTGVTYLRLPHGPAPTTAFDAAVSSLSITDKVSSYTGEYKGRGRIRYNSTAYPDMSGFSDEEMAVIDDVIAKYSDKNATDISGISHQDAPWIIADDNGPLDYEAVFYRDDDMSVRDYGKERRLLLPLVQTSAQEGGQEAPQPHHRRGSPGESAHEDGEATRRGGHQPSRSELLGIPRYEGQHFRCAGLEGKGSRSGYRLIHLEYRGDLFLLDLYHLNERDMHDEKLIRDALDVILEGDWTEHFDKQPGETCGFLLNRREKGLGSVVHPSDGSPSRKYGMYLYRIFTHA